LIRRVLTIAIVTLAVAYVGVLIAAFAGQRKILFPVPAGAHAPKRATLLRLEGGAVALSKPAAAGEPTVVYFHGNAMQLADSEWLGEQLEGVGFMAVEYPGYGLAASPEGPSEAGCYAAAETALKHLEATVPRDQIVLFGQSLGTGVAVEMAKRGHGARMILATPYTSITAIAGELLWFLPTRLLVRDPFDSLSKAKALSLPVLIVHGSADEVVPTAMGRALANEFPHAELMIVEGAHHNDLVDRPEVLARISAFAVGR
jgi:pimeloyl-ACP methyl ester carboxylesterase